MKRLSIGLVLLLFLVTACATAPVQEMSDARQALAAADAAEAKSGAPEHYLIAVQQMQRAEAALAQHHYDQARGLALKAKDQALEARKRAMAEQ